MTVPHHASDETLAAFADGRLHGRERQELVEHAAACDECRDILNALAEAQEQGVIDTPGGRVVEGRFGWAVGLAAIAAAIMGVAFLPSIREWVEFQRTGGVSELVEATEYLEEWPLQVRLSGGFPVDKPIRRIVRSADEQSDSESGDNYILRGTAAEVRLSANDRSARDQRAVALGYLLSGDKSNAVAAMEKAVQLRGADDPDYLNDLAAVYLERLSDDETPKALATAERAYELAKTPESTWNLARAYELSHRDADAIRLYREYLNLDSSSEFAKEATFRISRLERDPLQP